MAALGEHAAAEGDEAARAAAASADRPRGIRDARDADAAGRRRTGAADLAVTVLFTDDGRVLAGSVPAETLLDAAAGS